MCSLSICTRLLCLQVLQRAAGVPSIALCTFILCEAFAAWQPANVGFHLGYHRNKTYQDTIQRSVFIAAAVKRK